MQRDSVACGIRAQRVRQEVHSLRGWLHVQGARSATVTEGGFTNMERRIRTNLSKCWTGIGCISVKSQISIYTVRCRNKYKMCKCLFLCVYVRECVIYLQILFSSVHQGSWKGTNPIVTDTHTQILASKYHSQYTKRNQEFLRTWLIQDEGWKISR